MDLYLILIILLIGVLVALSAYFGCCETAYTGMNPIRVKNLAYEGNKKAERALANHEDYDKLLTTILVGNSVVNIAIATLSTMLFSEMLGVVWGAIAATVISITVILLFGEVTPKTLAKRNAERYALVLAGSMHMMMVILSPITWAFIKLAKFLSRKAKNDSADNPTLTEEELHVMIDEVTEEGALEQSEGELIKSAMQFDDIKVSEMYTPRKNITAASLDMDVDTLKRIFLESEYSRIPIYEGSVDRIIGAVHLKDFFSNYVREEKFTLEDIMMPVKFVPASTSIAVLLNDLQKAHIHMAVVLDNYGRTLGVVTMEDILEELVGEIWDESDDAVFPIQENKDGGFTVPGEAKILEVMRRIGIDFDAEDFQGQTVSAFISHRIEGIPKRGDTVDLGNSRITVRSMKSRRIREAKIYPVKDEAVPQKTQEN